MSDGGARAFWDGKRSQARYDRRTLAELVTCPRCHAWPQQPCTSGAGPTPNPHTGRLDIVRDRLAARRCPLHDIPDCSPLLNGCSLLTAGPYALDPS